MVRAIPEFGDASAAGASRANGLVYLGVDSSECGSLEPAVNTENQAVKCLSKSRILPRLWRRP